MSKQAIITIESNGIFIYWTPDSTDAMPQYFAVTTEIDESVQKRLAAIRQVVLVPTEDCMIRRLQSPVRNRNLLRTAVPFALEDELAVDLEELHVAFARRAGRTVDAVVVAHEKMQAWQQLLDQFGLSADVMLPAALTLPLEEGVWHVMLDQGMTQVRYGEFAGFAVEEDMLLDWIGLAGAQFSDKHGECPTLAVHGIDDAATSVLRARLEDAGWLVQRSAGALLPGAELPDFNLLQGDYRIDSHGSGVVRGWVWAAVCALLLGLGEVGYLAWDNVRLRGQVDNLAAEIKTIYLSASPEAKRVVNPRAQMEHLLSQHAPLGNKGFLGLLQNVAESFAEINSGEISRLSFNQGKLDMDVRVDAVSTVEALKQDLRERNVTLAVLSLNTAEQGIDAHLRAREPVK